MDLSRAKTELSNEYKMFEIQATTSLHFSFKKYSITLSIIIFSIFFSIFLQCRFRWCSAELFSGAVPSRAWEGAAPSPHEIA